jgi:DNA-binding NtrC family response regulator
MSVGCQPGKHPALARLIGESPAFLKAIGQIPTIASSGAMVMISGETGTGKELVAHAIHYLSGRAQFPFVAVNCGSLPDTLLEDELFGHERGAFTHAETRREGLIAQADRGTLFLDEIDTMAGKAQVDLLRVLQDRKYRVIGSSRERSADVRVIAATNVSTERLLRSGTFRTDLFYRLSVFAITLPPLRSRKEDIPALAAHFMQKHAPGDQRLRLGSSAVAALLSWDWPGNVRELENAVIRGIHLNRDGTIEEADLGLSDPTAQLLSAPEVSVSGPSTYRAMKRAAIEAFERKYLTRLMSEHGGNVSSAARAAGKERRGLGRLLKKYCVDPKSFRAWEAVLAPPTDSARSGRFSTRRAGSFSPSLLNDPTQGAV